MDQQLYDLIRQLQHDSFFRTVTDEGGDRIVDSPFIGGSVSSAFERLGSEREAAVELGRLGTHEVHYICWGIDAVSDGLSRIAEIPALTREGAITVRRMAGGRC